jgi:hypothetical protein
MFIYKINLQKGPLWCAVFPLRQLGTGEVQRGKPRGRGPEGQDASPVICGLPKALLSTGHRRYGTTCLPVWGAPRVYRETGHGPLVNAQNNPKPQAQERPTPKNTALQHGTLDGQSAGNPETERAPLGSASDHFPLAARSGPRFTSCRFLLLAGYENLTAPLFAYRDNAS